MIESLKLRILIIGNSGSGKSSLAERLGALFHAPIFDLDLIHWKDNGFGAKQDEDAARQKVADLAATERYQVSQRVEKPGRTFSPRRRDAIDPSRKSLIARRGV